MSQQPSPGHPPERRRNSCLVFGIVAGVVVLPLVVLGIWFVIEGATWLQGGIANAQFWSELDQDWRPPANADTSDAFLPQQITSFTRLSLDQSVRVPSLGLTNLAQHAVYQSRDLTLDAYVFTGGETELTALPDQIVGALTNRQAGGRRPYYSSRETMGQMFGFRSGPPDERVVLWRHTNQLFLVHKTGKEDLEPFLKLWLHTIDQRQEPKLNP